MLLTVVMWKHPSQYYQPACFPLCRSDQGSTETSFVHYHLLLFAQPVKVRGAQFLFLVAFASFWIADLESVYRLMLASLGTKDFSWSSTSFCNVTLIATISARYKDVVEPAGASTKCSFWLWLSVMLMSAPALSSRHFLNTDPSMYILIAADPSLLIVSSTTSRLNSAVSSLCTC